VVAHNKLIVVVVIEEGPLGLQQLVILRHRILRPHYVILENVVIRPIAPDEEVGVESIVDECSV
jgi:hypothetical protein